MTILIEGWTKGCNSVAAIKAIHGVVGFSLRQALDIVTRVLEGEIVSVDVEPAAEAEALSRSLIEVGFHTVCRETSRDANAQEHASTSPRLRRLG